MSLTTSKKYIKVLFREDQDILGSLGSGLAVKDFCCVQKRWQPRGFVTPRCCCVIYYIPSQFPHLGNAA